MENIKDGFDTFERLVNNMGFSPERTADIVVENFLKTHRTLQQCMVRMIVAVIRKLGKFYEDNPNRFDDRNKSSVEWIKQASKIEGYFPLI